MHLAMLFNKIAQYFMPWFKKRPIGFCVHKWPGGHAQIIAKPDYIHNVAHSIAHLFQCCQMAFQQVTTRLSLSVAPEHTIHQNR